MGMRRISTRDGEEYWLDEETGDLYSMQGGRRTPARSAPPLAPEPVTDEDLEYVRQSLGLNST